MRHFTAEVEDGAEVGEGTVIWHLCHVRRGAKIGRKCSLGRNVFVDSGAVLGDEVRVQNNVSIYNGVTIESSAFIGPHVVFTNDKYPRAYPIQGGWKCVPTLVRYRASIGAGAVVVCGVTIGEFAMIGAGAVVTRDVKPYELIIGFGEHAGFVDFDGRPKC